MVRGDVAVKAATDAGAAAASRVGELKSVQSFLVLMLKLKAYFPASNCLIYTGGDANWSRN